MWGPTSPPWGVSPDQSYDPVNLDRETLLAPGGRPFPVLDPDAGARMQSAIAQAKEDLDSLGGLVECAVIGLPAGLGDPMLDGMENRIARLAFAIPAVKGVAFGAGFAVADRRGSQNNDPFTSTRPARCAPAPTTPGAFWGHHQWDAPHLPGGL